MNKTVIENFFRNDAARFYSAFLPNISTAKAGGELKACCPFHDDRNPSLTINAASGLFNCFGCNAAGSIFDFYAKIKGLDARKDLNRVIIAIAEQFNIAETEGPAKTKATSKVVARYDYRDENGKVIYQKERMEPKDFRQRRPDGKGGWISGLGVTQKTLYHLPDILNASEIFVCEGEKDTDNVRALGFAATTSGGTNTWVKRFADLLVGKHVVLLPHNDEPGRKFMKDIAVTLQGKAASIKILDIPDLPDKGDVSDFIAQIGDRDAAAERLSVMIEGWPEYTATQKDTPAETSSIQIINAADWLNIEPAQPDQILADTFDLGDKIAIIGSSKMRKSFFLLQMIICIASGRPYLSWSTPKARRVLHIQLEIQSHHYHHRVRRMASAIGIGPDDLGDRLQILNGRGLGLSGAKGITKIREIAKKFTPELITIDPLYKISQGVENAAEDLKIILSSFDTLAEDTGAAIAYVHHDAKGSPGDRDIRDRGAGSNVLGRDYDGCLTLSAHSQDEEAAVVDVLLRNYRPQDPFSIRWAEDEASGGYKFEMAPDIMPEKKTSKTKAPQTPFPSYMPIVDSILGEEEMDITLFKNIFKDKSGLSDHKIRDFLKWATDPFNHHILTREERGYKTHTKWLRLAR